MDDLGVGAAALIQLEGQYWFATVVVDPLGSGAVSASLARGASCTISDPIAADERATNESVMPCGSSPDPASTASLEIIAVGS